MRLRENFLDGTTTDNPLTAGATTINSAELANLQAVASPDIAVLVLDPDGDGNGPEIVHVTAHTASATSATISRGEEGTTGVSHATGTVWRHAPTANDYGDYQLIDHQELGSTASAITFDNIPAFWHDLFIIGEVRANTGSANADHPSVRVGNGTVDSGSNYQWGVWQHYASDNTIDYDGTTGATLVQAGYNSTPTSGNTAGLFGTWQCTIHGYADSTYARYIRGESGLIESAKRWVPFNGRWVNTADVIDIVSVIPTVASDWAVGSRLSLYGRGLL